MEGILGLIVLIFVLPFSLSYFTMAGIMVVVKIINYMICKSDIQMKESLLILLKSGLIGTLIFILNFCISLYYLEIIYGLACIFIGLGLWLNGYFLHKRCKKMLFPFSKFELISWHIVTGLHIIGFGLLGAVMLEALAAAAAGV